MFLNGGQRNLLNYMEFSKVEDARVRDEIIENSNLTADKYDELFSGDDVFLTAQQALDYGLIDEIVDTIDPVPFNDELKAEYLKPEECEHDDAPCVDIEDENGEPDPATS